MKKLVALIAITIYSSIAFATNGPYVGIGLGYSNSIFNVDQHATETGGPKSGQSWRSFHGISGGVQGQLVAGYIYDINRLRLGLEITSQLLKTQHSDKASSSDSRNYEFIYSYGANFVPGYYITNKSLVYLKVGAIRGKFTCKDVSDTGYHFLDASFYSAGLNLGLGMEMYLTKNIGLKLEYIYTRYATRKFTSLLNLPKDIKVSVDNKVQPQVHTVMLGIDYYFNLT